jgi:ATP-dependent DNA helicase DinG
MGDLRRLTADVFEGDILEAIPGYRPRSRQIAMAISVAGAMEDLGIHLFEAGTGVGKSLAYLVPAVLSGRRIFISTATRTLQDQLRWKDIPDICRVLDFEPSISVLKGRGNYLCLRKWERLQGEDGPADLLDWSLSTATGDVSELSGEADPAIWARVRCDAVDCLSKRCGRRAECHFLRARSEARKARILILNHHLLVSALSTEEMLPEAEVLVADEGHRLEDAAAECLGWSLSSGSLLPVFDGIAFSPVSAETKAELLGRTRDLAQLVEQLLAQAGPVASWDPGKNADLLEAVSAGAGELASAMAGEEDLEPAARAAESVASNAGGMRAAEPSEHCFFIEGSGRSAAVRAVPLDLGESLRKQIYACFDTSIITSATLTVAGSFEYSASRLGASDCSSAVDFGSPFDFGAQAVLLVPEDLPDPEDHMSLSRCAWHWASLLASTLGGRTLALFTSNRNLALSTEAALANPIARIRILAQGHQSRSAILESFRGDPSAVILGTSTFWEGVDLPGSLLQAVVIDRLPFPSPGHPLTAARMDRIAREGGSPFRDLTLPSAVIRLRQGVGRLIRSPEDRGLVILLDRRIRTASYGRVILRSLPAFRPVDEPAAMSFAMECASREPAGKHLGRCGV